MVRPDAPYLTLAEISKHWARERGEPRDEVFAALLAAFWRGEFEVEGMAGPRLMRAKVREVYVAFEPGRVRPWSISSEEDPRLDEDGHAERPRSFELVDIDRCRIFDMVEGVVPNDLTPVRDHPDMDCSAGPAALFGPTNPSVHRLAPPAMDRDFEQLADEPLSCWKEGSNTRLVLKTVLHRIVISCGDFERWIEFVGWPRPRFWFPAGRIPERLGDQSATSAADVPNPGQPTGLAHKRRGADEHRTTGPLVEQADESRVSAGSGSGEARQPPPSVTAIKTFLLGFADGNKTEIECRRAAEGHFRRPIPQKGRWRAAWKELPPEKKLPVGKRPRRSGGEME